MRLNTRDGVSIWTSIFTIMRVPFSVLLLDRTHYTINKKKGELQRQITGWPLKCVFVCVSLLASTALTGWPTKHVSLKAAKISQRLTTAVCVRACLRACVCVSPSHIFWARPYTPCGMISGHTSRGWPHRICVYNTPVLVYDGRKKQVQTLVCVRCSHIVSYYWYTYVPSTYSYE